MSKELKEGYPGREVPKSETVTTLPVENPDKGHVKKITDKRDESSYFPKGEDCGPCDE